MSKRNKPQHVQPGVAELQKIITGLSHRHQIWQVWEDFLLMSATAISNSVDWQQRDERETRYMRAVSRYSRDEAIELSRALACLVETLECGYGDVLGEAFMGMDLGNKYRGQFFTPYHVCKLMAGIGMHGCDDIIASKGFVSANEPACGGGATVIALADHMRSIGLNPQTQLHVVAQDVDETCCMMAYIQLSLLNIPAVVVHGNTLAMEERAHWYTPAHILGLWNTKLKRGHLLGYGDSDGTLIDEGTSAPAADNDNRQAIDQTGIAVGHTFSLF